MRKYKFLFLVSLFLLIFSSCSNNDIYSNTTNSNTETISYTPDVINHDNQVDDPHEVTKSQEVVTPKKDVIDEEEKVNNSLSGSITPQEPIESENSEQIEKSQDPNDNYKEPLISIDLDFINNIIEFNKDEIIKYLGTNYETETAGPEGCYEGYYFKDYNLTFVFDYFEYKDNKIVFISAGSNLDICGAREGMSFDQIEQILGECIMPENWDYSESNIKTLRYDIGKCTIDFMSYELNQEDCYIVIHRTSWFKMN